MGYCIDYMQAYLKEEEYEFVEKLNNSVGNGLPRLIVSTLKLLEQAGDMPGYISDSDIVALYKMLKLYWDKCSYVSMTLDKIEANIEYARVEKYLMFVAGKSPRIATLYEVNNGSTGLEMEYVYPLGEDIYKYLILLLWASSGNDKLLYRIGYTLEFSKDGKVATPFRNIIYMVANDLYNMMNWCSVEVVADVEKKLRSLKRKKQLIMCVEYAVDEVRDTLPAKELVYQANKILPRNSSDKDIRRALSIIINCSRYSNTPRPMELVLIRKACAKVISDNNTYKSEKDEASKKLKDKCDFIEDSKARKLINGNHFCFRIIETLKKNSYSICSVKQNEILDDAVTLIRKNEVTENEKQGAKEETPIVDIDNIMGITDILGSGGISSSEGE